jgi:hypothetical protein
VSVALGSLDEALDRRAQCLESFDRMPPYRVTYKDGRIQEVEADTYGRQGDRYVFTHDRGEILNLAADVVESIAFADVPEAT